VADAPILDIYAPLSHKEQLTARSGKGALAPTWVPDTEWRRLTAYKLLKSYGLNVSREFFSGADVTETDRAKRREYGDADLLVDRIRAGVLGEGPEIVVDGADVDLPDEPDLPPAPEEPDGEGDEATVRRRVFTARQTRWRDQVEDIVSEWEQAWTDLPGLQERQDWLRAWADDEGYWSKLHEGEGDTVELGDGVYTLAWSADKQRPILRVYDPGFYFPVLTEDQTDEDFPSKVHLAWEFTGEDHKQYIRRLTWELVELPEGEARTYPWDVPSDDGGENAPARPVVTCLFSDGTWEMREIGPNGLYDLSDNGVTWATTEDGLEARDLDLGLDFIPVVHVPNTPASRTHFGQSALLVVAQLLDDIHRSDTNVQAAADLAAGPMVAMFGAGSDTEVRVQPGTAFKLSKDGRMDVLDLSAGLQQIMASNDSLRDLLSINGRVPKAVIGRIDASEAPSGVALALSFSPFAQLVGAFRMTREAKHKLLLKFVQRIAQAGGVLEDGENPPAKLAFGSFLPTDRTAVVEEVTTLLEARAISTQTAVGFLVAAGFDIEDARNEVQRIRSENPEAAKYLADATGSEEEAAKWMGIELPEQPTATAQPPEPELPEPGQPVPPVEPTAPAPEIEET
jgi:hypothetical protein